MARVAFRQRDVEALLRAAKAVGHEAPTVDILPDGRLRLLTNPPAEEADELGVKGWEEACRRL